MSEGEGVREQYKEGVQWCVSEQYREGVQW